MNEPSKSSPVDPLPELKSWNESRSGAWASRGFHYQHLVSVLILVRQWAGLAPLGYLVPEGLDDCVIELSDRRVAVQIKSRKDAGFRDAEVLGILDAAEERAAKLSDSHGIRSTVILEQPRINKVEADIACFFDDENGRVFLCRTPIEEIVQLLSTQLNIADVTADGLASDLYRLVAEAAAENASLSFEERRRISATEVDRRIFERLEATDPTAIDHALLSGVLEPVDLTTPVNEPDFYRGVKVKPGHVASNLVLDRPNDVTGILDKLWRRRHVLVSGPSGAGKSALVWLATAAAGHTRWYQITGMATAADAEAIVRFVRARCPTELSPLGLVLDEVRSGNSYLWDVLVRELRGLPNLYFLGSVRQEDVNLVTNQSDTVFFQVVLGEDLARAVWEKLAARNGTNWSHWREPFEQSEGLMLEYIHLLTQGQRLAAVIEEQVRLRERECRDDELRIIRSTAVLCARGGEVAADRLFVLLDLEPDAANRALRRLIDEHLVRESPPGVLGGLHMLRSDALVKASHDETVFLAADTLWRSLPATTGDTLPRVIQSVLADSGDDREQSSVPKLADMLGKSRDIDQWTAILTGLGLATVDCHVTSFMSILDQYGVERAHWSLASVYADPLLDIPNLEASDQWTRLRNALLVFRALPKHDLRATCLAQLSAGSAPPLAENILQANKLLSSLLPICGSDPIQIAFRHEFLVDCEKNIRQISRLLSTAYLIDQKLAQGLAQMLGGEPALFELFRSQIPWTTPPVIERDSRNGRTVRSNWHQVSDKHQPDPHEAICEICEILIGISPDSDAAASDAVDPTERPIAIAGYQPWSKNMPRANLPAKARVAWNVAFRQILLARSAAYSLTDYTSDMANLVRRTEKVFRSLSEKWIKGKRVSHADGVTSEITRIVDAVNALAYAAPEKTPSTMTEAVGAGTEDTLGALLNGVLSNLLGRLSKLDTAKTAATFAGNLSGRAREKHQSAIWRSISSPPLTELAKLSERLDHIACILHEIAHDSRQEAINRIIKVTKRASMGGAVRAAARHCRVLAEGRFNGRLRVLEDALAGKGWKARCISRPIHESDSPYWPARKVAILVEVEDLVSQWTSIVEELPSFCTRHLDNDWPFSAVPVMYGQILASLAVLPTSHMPLPHQEFVQDWGAFVDTPIHSSVLLEKFDEALASCVQISAILKCRRIDGLHPDEDDLFLKAVNTFKKNREIIRGEADRTEMEPFALALDHLDRNWNLLAGELEAAEAGSDFDDPLCMAFHRPSAGRESEHIVEIVAIRLALLEAECKRLETI